LGDSLAVLAASRYGGCALRPAIPVVIVLGHQRPEVAVSLLMQSIPSVDPDRPVTSVCSPGIRIAKHAKSAFMLLNNLNSRSPKTNGDS
jgi:hypothetical protein